MLHLRTKADFVTVCENKLEEVALVMQQGGRHGSHWRASCAAVKLKGFELLQKQPV